MNVTIEEQVRATRRGVALWLADDIGIARFRGPDAAAFLNTMLTADIKRLNKGSGTPAFQCTPKGQALALLSVQHVGDDDFLLLDRRDDIPRLLESLEKLHFSEAFTSKDESEALGVIAAQGPKARDLLASTVTTIDAAGWETLVEGNSLSLVLDGEELICIAKSLSGDAGFLLLTPRARQDALLTRLFEAGKAFEVVAPDAAAVEVLRIEAGLPRFGLDLPAGGLASEFGIDHKALNYDKGCFVGQEVIARIRTKGEVPHRVMGLMMPEGTAPPAPGTTFRAPDGAVGATVSSAASSPTLGRAVAIARVARGCQTPGVKLRGENDGCAEVAELPFPLPLPAPERRSSKLYDEALALFARNQEDEAIALLKRELENNPRNLDAWEALGVIHDRQGRHHDAIAAMKRIIDAEPGHLMANVNLSMFFMKIGDKGAAEDFQAKATRISMERRIAEQRARGGGADLDAETQRIKTLEARIEKFKAIIGLDPNDVLGHFGAGRAYLDLKRYRNAAEHFEKVLAIQSDYSVAWANLGAAYAALGENDKAAKTFERGIEVAKGKGDLMPMRDMQLRLEKLRGEDTNSMGVSGESERRPAR